MKKLLLAGSIFCWVLGQNAICPNVSLSDEPSQPTQTEISSKSAPAQVTILNPGAQPRQVLRFTPAIGARQTVKMKMTMGMNMLIDNQPYLDNVNFTTETTIDTTVKKIDANGDIHVSYLYSKIDVINNSHQSAAAQEQFRSEMSELVGFGASIILDPQGNPKKTYDFVFPEKMTSEVREQMIRQSLDSFSQIYSPLPAQAVGIGAKWQVTQEIPIVYLQQKIEQNIIYELVERQDNLLNLVSTVEQKADLEKIKLPVESSEASLQVESFVSLGAGQITMDLGQMMPISSTASIKSNMMMKTESPELEKPIHGNLTFLLNLNIESQ